MSERLLAIHARLQELTEDVLALIAEERNDAKREHARKREQMDDVAWTVGEGPLLEQERRQPRFGEPSHDAPAVPCCDYAEREQNARPETHTHDVALDEGYTNRLDACGE